MRSRQRPPHSGVSNAIGRLPRSCVQNRGLHATFPRSGLPGAACVKCHSDHNGVDFQTDPMGSHSEGIRSCEDRIRARREARGRELPLLPYRATYLRTSAHSARGKDLNSNLAWSLARLHHLPRGQAPGPLRNRLRAMPLDRRLESSEHRQGDLRPLKDPLSTDRANIGTFSARAVTPPGRTASRDIRGFSFRSCSDCHRDPHKGEFKQGCDSCHTTFTWKKSSFTTTFDHSKTNFPLLGKAP